MVGTSSQASTHAAPPTRAWGNASSFAVSEIVRKGVLFLSLLLIARQLGPTAFGEFNVVLAIAGALALVADLGMNDHALREAARSGAVGGVVGEVLTLKMLTAGMALLIGSMVASLVWDTRLLNLFLILLAYSLITNNLSQLPVQAFRAAREVPREAAVRLVEFGALLGLVIVLQPVTRSAGDVALIFLAASVAGVVASYGMFSWRFGRPRPSFHVARLLRRLRAAGPYAAAAAMVWVTPRTQVMLLGAARQGEAAGIYSVAFQLVTGLMLFPHAIAIARYRRMCDAVADPAELRRRALTTLGLVLLVSLPLAIIVWSLAPRIVEVGFGPTYAGAVGVMRLLAISMVPLFLNVTFVFVFQAIDRIGTLVALAAVELSLNVGLGAALVPRAGADGAALALLVAESLACMAMVLAFLSATRMRSKEAHGAA